MTPSANLRDFQDLLRDLFQFDVADLDFGIYRILNEKRDHIERFIEEDLVEGVREELGAYDTGQTGPSQETASAETERRIYDDLVRFFSRYYDGGDVVTKRRFAAGDATYYVPYDGEEVLLHWANRDHYYVKTAEHFRTYRFSVRGVDVHFQLVDAQVPQDNVKASDTRHFVLQGQDPVAVDAEAASCTIRFAYRPITEAEDERLLRLYNDQQSKSRRRKTNDRSTIVAATVQQISDAIDDATVRAKLTQPREGDETSPLRRHLNRYTAKHTADYFIHKDLDGFLRGQLEFFIQNEVLQLSDVLQASERRRVQQIDRAKVVKKIGERIIDFLAQIENFQKRLFEKKKFVVDTGYCVTLDRVPDDLYDDILNNDAQLDEWRALYAVDRWDDDLFRQGYLDGTFTKAFLASNPAATIDTRHFDTAFTDRLLSHLSDLDPDDGLEGVIDGFCIQGENFQALNLLQERFKASVDCVYIDPPYNSKSSEILYKNTYKHSSWLSLMQDRLRKGRALAKPDAVHVVAIDENEQERLGLLFDEVFSDYDRTCVTVEHNPRGVQGDNFSYTHEYAYFLFPSQGSHIRQQVIDEAEWEFSNLRNWGGESRREDGRNCFYPIVVKDGAVDALGEVPPDDHHPESRVEDTGDGRTRIWPIDREGVERKWRYKADSLRDVIDTVRVRTVNGELEVEIARSRETPRTVWTGSRYDAGTHGSRRLSGMIGREKMPDTSVFPKSIHTVADCLDVTVDTSEDGHVVLDYFAGSGSTGEALMRLDRSHGGDNTYVLVEMGDYFDSLLLPRLRKAAFSESWSDGVPDDRRGQSHVLRYHRLESYEDALNNIEVETPGTEMDVFDRFDDYAVRYMLPTEARDSETLLTPDAFARPFDYTLRIRHGMGGATTHPVDLESTFNYLIGLQVQTRRVYTHQRRRYVVVTGRVEREQAIDAVLVVWRNRDALDLAQEKAWAAETLPDGPFDTVYVNGPSHIHGKAEPLDIPFRETMDPAAA